MSMLRRRFEDAAEILLHQSWADKERQKSEKHPKGRQDVSSLDASDALPKPPKHDPSDFAFSARFAQAR